MPQDWLNPISPERADFITSLLARPRTVSPEQAAPETAAWLAQKRQEIKDWLARHEDADADLLAAQRAQARSRGEEYVSPAETLRGATDVFMPRTMADLMMLSAGPVSGAVRRAVPRSPFRIVSPLRKAEAYERARRLDPESGLWNDDALPQMDLYQAKSGEDIYYGLSPSPISPGMKEIEMVSRKNMPA